MIRLMPTPIGSLGRDVVSGYALAVCRVTGWAAVFAMVWRSAGAEAFAVLALARGTIGLLRLAGFGLAPATVRLLAETEAKARQPLPADDVPVAAVVGSVPVHGGSVYGGDWPPGRVAYWSALVAAVVGFGYAATFHLWHDVPAGLAEGEAVGQAVALLGVAVALRLLGEPASAVLQHDDRLHADQWALCVAELAWPAFLASWFIWGSGDFDFVLVAAAGSAAGAELLGALLRIAALGARANDAPLLLKVRPYRRLLVLGGFVTLAQAADFLYAPIDYVLLNRFVDGGVAAYAPAVQIDAALLLLAGAASAIVLPRAAKLDAGGDGAGVWRLYLIGTLVTAGVLVAGAIVAWLAAPLALRLWLGDAPAATLDVLPFVLAGTVIGGSGAVGRGVLLGMGRARAVAISVLIAGGFNALVSTLLVTQGYGLRGVVYGTVLAAAARCLVWQPWYVWQNTWRRGEV
jgi:O-antigen/teichoic acid export membrane protein